MDRAGGQRWAVMVGSGLSDDDCLGDGEVLPVVDWSTFPTLSLAAIKN